MMSQVFQVPYVTFSNVSGDTFCTSRKGGTEGGGGAHEGVQTAWLCLGLGWDWEDYFSPFGINGLRNEPFHIVWPQFPVFKASFSSVQSPLHKQ